ncbi:FAD-dependent oxidoreductase [Dermatobacter hominis]|uniref:FAD-dependent oxidoreductase n=1 Tax=Dermatobacter hominis TaxID=2884263 RepID=UPI001D10DDF2|nr:FAD-dependent oxidoreductase [Dermatobacter hominis]UDY34140.1 FAD-dependent oxidoreductase [Dermatobacter hominis]
MGTDDRRVAAVVVGAGTAGLNAALQLARRGLSVTVVESRPLGEGGARWDNGVLAWQYARAGLAPPTADEVHTGTGRTFLLGPADAGPVVVESPTEHADMRRLNDRLVALCRAERVDFLDRARDVSVELVDGRVRALALSAAPPDAAEAAPVRLEADLFVDAGGRRGVLRSQVPELAAWCPPVGRDVLCTASQFMLDVADADGARAFLDGHGATPGDGVTWVGLDGGFSALAVGVAADLGEVSVLTGAIASGEWGSGRTILDRFRGANPWIGEPRYGGDGLIPLRRPYARLGASGVALVGDAACQVFPAHGSGIGTGLMAGAVLAEQVGGAADPGADGALWAYQTAYHREHGGTLAAYDTFRRCNSAVGTDGVRRMFESGLFTADMGGSGLEQRWDEPSAAQSLSATRAYARDPGLARAMLPWLARCAVASRLGAAAPAEPDLGALRRWDRRLARVVGG